MYCYQNQENRINRAERSVNYLFLIRFFEYVLEEQSMPSSPLRSDMHLYFFPYFQRILSKNKCKNNPSTHYVNIR